MKFRRTNSEKGKNDMGDALLLALTVGTVSKKGENIKVSCGSTEIEKLESLQECFIIDSLHGEKDRIVISLTLK